MNARAAGTLVVLVLLLAGAVAWRMMAGGGGGAAISAADWAGIMELRAWRVATGVTVGACLALAGVLLQALLRNPLASPDITGMSAAASLGVMVSLYLASAVVSGAGAGAGVGVAGGWGGGGVGEAVLQSRPWQAGPALIGALGALAVVYVLSQRRGLLDPTAMVLIGVIVSVMCGAGVMLLQHLMPGLAMTAGAMRLLVGAISDDVSRVQVAAVAALAGGATAVSWRLGPWMDAASLGDDEAASLGVAIGRMRLLLLGLAGLLTAGAVVLAGPLGFVGLIAPHAVRLMAGPGLGSGGRRKGDGGDAGKWAGSRLVVLGSVLAGAALVVGADALVKTFPTRAGNMPIGIITALLGGAVFIGLLRAERSR